MTDRAVVRHRDEAIFAHLAGAIRPGARLVSLTALHGGVSRVLIPRENWQEMFGHQDRIAVIPVCHLREVLDYSILTEAQSQQGNLLLARPAGPA